MFKNLLKFEYNRNLKESIGFYIAYFIFLMIVSGLMAGLIGLMVDPQDNFNFGLKIGNIIAIVTTLSLSFLILFKKNLLNNFGYLLIALISGLLATLGGGILGLIPVAFLTTRKNK